MVLEAGWRYYTDPAERFSLALPSSWERRTDASGAALIAGDKRGNAIAVLVEEVASHFTADSYADLVRQRLVSTYEAQGLSVRVVRHGALRVPSGQAAEVWLSLNQDRAKQSYFVVVRDGRAWMVSIVTPAGSSIRSHEARFDTVAATFRFV